jgi:Uri superfamily endonuclease
MKGTYVLIIESCADVDLAVGKMGSIAFKEGYYAYVGSALSGLEQRLRRHLREPGANKKLHWHIDYLLAHPAVEVRAVVTAETEERLECKIAANLRQQLFAVPHFGSTDCSCFSHLFFSPERAELETRVKASFQAIGADFRTTTIKPV